MKKMPGKRICFLIIAALLFAALLAWTIWSNTALEVNEWKLRAETILPEFSGFRIAHVSDLHNAEIGERNCRLLSALREAEPDIIAITGDILDSRRTDTELAFAFLSEAVKIAPCYFVSGNHEERIAGYDGFKLQMEALGVTVLEDECISLERDGAGINLIGLQDPSFDTPYLTGDAAGLTKAKLEGFSFEDGYTLLLSHRPELFEIYVQSGADLVLSGHAHGGQIRLPFLGGLFAPNQGFFPEYDGGLYSSGDTSMLVSRGIGNSLFPLRFNNRPELLLIELRAD